MKAVNPVAISSGSSHQLSFLVVISGWETGFAVFASLICLDPVTVVYSNSNPYSRPPLCFGRLFLTRYRRRKCRVCRAGAGSQDLLWKSAVVTAWMKALITKLARSHQSTGNYINRGSYEPCFYRLGKVPIFLFESRGGCRPRLDDLVVLSWSFINKDSENTKGKADAEDRLYISASRAAFWNNSAKYRSVRRIERATELPVGGC